MNAILHRFKIELTRAQATFIRQEFMSHAKNQSGMLIVQPIGAVNLFDPRVPSFDCAVLKPAFSRKLQKLLIAAQKRPK